MGFKFKKDDLVSRVVTRLDEKKINDKYHSWSVCFISGSDWDTGEPIEEHYRDLRSMTPVYHRDDLQAIVFSGSRDVDYAYGNVDGIAITTTLTIADFDSAIRINGHNISEYIYKEAREFSDEKILLMKDKKVKLKIKTHDIGYVYELTALFNSRYGNLYFTIISCEDYTDEDLDNLARVLGDRYSEYPYYSDYPKRFVVCPKDFLGRYEIFEIEEI